ncbi:MAG: flagellar biosynthetic protein FliR [Frankiales bacterium]|nr:flagellar biosynthetic protein FliR [Frankiales bacterium]
MSTLPFSTATISVFLLVLARTGAWVITAPVLSAKGMSSIGRLSAALALALFVTPMTPASQVPADLPNYIAAALGQVVVGLVLGMLTNLLFSAFEVAGTLADLSGGFSYASIVDPMSGQPAAAFSRLFSVCFSAIFFASEAYASVVGGFVRSFKGIPLGHFPSLASGTATTLGHAATQILLSAFEVAAPLLGVLFLTDVALSFAARFVPQANALSLALPVKTLIALTTAGTTLALLPAHAAQLLDPSLRLPFEVLR